MRSRRGSLRGSYYGLVEVPGKEILPRRRGGRASGVPFLGRLSSAPQRPGGFWLEGLEQLVGKRPEPDSLPRPPQPIDSDHVSPHCVTYEDGQHP